VEEAISASSQGAAGDIHPPSTYEVQLLQMFADMEEMAKQQAFFDCERERLEEDRENVAHEWEEMKCLKAYSSPRSRPSRTPVDRLHRQRSLLLRRLQVASSLKARGVVE